MRHQVVVDVSDNKRMFVCGSKITKKQTKHKEKSKKNYDFLLIKICKMEERGDFPYQLAKKRK